MSEQQQQNQREDQEGIQQQERVQQQADNIPSEIAEQLTDGAQQIFAAAYKSAQEDGMSEEGARQVAWTTVKGEYVQGEDGKWHKKPEVMNEENTNPVTRAAVQSGGN